MDREQQHSRASAAAYYLSRGFMPVPVPAGGKRPVLHGWQRLKLTDADLPEQFAGPGNVGILLGPASGGLVDVDLDCPEAVELFPKYFPATKMVGGRATRPGSHHFYVAHGVKTTQFKDPKTGDMIIEVRGQGAQTLVWPSVHPDDRDAYQRPDEQPAFADGNTLIAGAEALFNEVVRLRHGDEAFPKRKAGLAVTQQATPSISPNDALARARAYLAKIPGAISGHGGHGQTYWAATAMVHGFGLESESVLRLLLDEFNPRCDPPWSEAELRHKVDDAATKEHQHPRLWLLAPSGGALAKRPGGRSGGTFPTTDLGNAERLVNQHGDSLRYLHQAGRWLVWDGRRWKYDDEGAPMRWASGTARSIIAEANGCEDQDKRSELLTWAKASEFKTRLEAMVSLARSQDGIPVRPEDLDADPMLFNVLNGTIDLRTGELRPHRREDLITKLAPVVYDPAAACPRFDAFLLRIMAGSTQSVDLLRRALGMCLTGDISVQVLLILHGCGANGKSVLMDTVVGLAGDYATVAPSTLLTDNGREEHPTEIADLMGRRLVVASETEDGASLKMQRVKQLTGDTYLKGRLMRQDFFTFRRTHKTILVTNNRPRVYENSEAVWRRLMLIPFGVIIPPAERDTSLLERLKDEWPGILALLARGCVEWQRFGLGNSDAALRATSDYRAEEDSVGKYLAEQCDVDQAPEKSDGFTPIGVLLKGYQDFCVRSGMKAVSGGKFCNELTRRGLASDTKRWHGKTCKVRVGVRLRADADQGESG